MHRPIHERAHMRAHVKLRFGSVDAFAAYGGRAIADALLPHGGVHRKAVRFNASNLEISESVWLGLSNFIYNICNIITYNTFFRKIYNRTS